MVCDVLLIKIKHNGGDNIKRYFITVITTIIICTCGVLGVYIYTTKNSEKVVETNFYNVNNQSTQTYNFNAKLDQIVFLGDSITQGYVVYDKLPSTQVIHKKGMSAEGMFTTPMFYMDKQQRLDDILSDFKPKMLYIGFGMNDLKKTPQEFYSIYKKNLEKLKELCPNTQLVLVSITPINTTEYKNETVDEFNNKIKQIANELGKNCYYMNIHDLLSDSNGKLKSEYDSGDGIHLKPEAYDVILNFYKSHLNG